MRVPTRTGSEPFSRTRGAGGWRGDRERLSNVANVAAPQRDQNYRFAERQEPQRLKINRLGATDAKPWRAIHPAAGTEPLHTIEKSSFLVPVPVTRIENQSSRRRLFAQTIENQSFGRSARRKKIGYPSPQPRFC